MQVAEMREFISAHLSPEDELPDWVTVGRWKEKIEKRGLPVKEGLLQLMELHYNRSFGAKDPVLSLNQVSILTGYSVKTIKLKAKGFMFQWGRPYVLRKADYKKLFGKGKGK